MLAIGAVFVAGVAEAGEDPELPDPSDQVILLQGDATVTAVVAEAVARVVVVAVVAKVAVARVEAAVVVVADAR